MSISFKPNHPRKEDRIEILNDNIVENSPCFGTVLWVDDVKNVLVIVDGKEVIIDYEIFHNIGKGENVEVSVKKHSFGFWQWTLK